MSPNKNQQRVFPYHQLHHSFQTLIENKHYVTISGNTTETYVAVRSSGDNGGWLVARWGRDHEDERAVCYLVCDPSTARAEDRSLMTAWCTCKGYRYRGRCRHQAIVSLATQY